MTRSLIRRPDILPAWRARRQQRDLFELFQQFMLRAATPNPNEYLTMEEASEYLGLSIGFLNRMRKEGQLPYVLDRCVKVKRCDLDKLQPEAKQLRDTTDQLRRTVRQRKAG